MAARQPFWDGTGGIGDLAWETCWIGGYYIPGLVSVVWRKAPRRRIEKKPVKGKDGTRVTDQGDELAEFTVRSEIYTADQWVTLQDVLPEIWASKDGGERTPYEIMHPLPNAMGIQDIYIESLAIHQPANQIMLLEIQCFQWKPNPVQVSKAAGRNDPNVVAGGKAINKKIQEVYDQNPLAQAGQAIGNFVGNLGSYFS